MCLAKETNTYEKRVVLLRICSYCKEEKDIDQFYSQNKTRANGSKYIYYNPECKKCTIKKSTLWLTNNKDKRKVSNHRYSISDKGKKHFYKYGIQYRKDGRRKEWEQNNKNKLKKYRIERMTNKKHDISKLEWEYCKSYFDFKCAYCGISEDEHKKIHNQQLHKEHVDPNGKNDLSNCIPACKSCNSSKHYSSLEDWYTLATNVNYTDKRINIITKWLSEDYILLKNHNNN